MGEQRVNIRLDEDLHTKAKVISTIKDTTLNAYLEEAIAEKLERDDDVLDQIPR